MQQLKKVALNTGFLYARMAFTVLISLYTTRLILNALGADDFGIFGVVGGVIIMLTFLNTALAGATQRFMSFTQGEGNPIKQKNIFNVSLVLHLIIGFVIVLLIEGAGYFLVDGILNISPARLFAAKMIYQFMVISTFFAVISVPYDALINAKENMLLVAIMGTLEALMKLAVAVYITFSENDKLITYGLLMSCISILLLIIQGIYCHLKYDEAIIKPKKYFNKSLFNEMTRFAGWSFLGSASNMIANYGQGVIINIFFGTRVNAASGIGAQVSGQLSAFAGTMMKALNPLIAKSEGAGKRSLMIEAVIVGSKTSFFLLTLFFIPAMLEMPYIFKIWLKNVPEFTVLFCQLLLIRNLIEQLFVSLASSISAHGNIRNYQIISSILNFFPLLISYILFKMGNPAYVLFIVFIIYSILSSAITLYFTHYNYQFPVSYFLKHAVGKCILSFFIIYLVALIPVIYMDEGFSRLSVVIITSTLAYPVSIWFIGLGKNERSILNQLRLKIVAKYLPAKFYSN